MNTIKKLKYASQFINVVIGFQNFLILGLVVLYFHAKIQPEVYSKLTVDPENGIILKLGKHDVPKTYEAWQNSEQLFYYTKLDEYSKIRMVWPKVIQCILFILILRLFNQFLKNTNSFELFFSDNVHILNKIIKYLLISWALNLILNTYFNPITMIFEDENIPAHVSKGKLNFDFMLVYPILLVFFFTMKEVFKRGFELKQENDLTI